MLVCTLSEVGAQALLHIEGVDNVFCNCPIWNLWASGDLDHAEQAVWCHLMLIPHLLQLVRRRLQCCFAGKLHICFTDYETSPNIRMRVRRSAVNFHFLVKLSFKAYWEK